MKTEELVRLRHLWYACLPDWPIGIRSLCSRIRGGVGMWHDDIGYIHYLIANGAAQITVVLVQPEHQHSGIGSRLVKRAKAKIHAEGIDSIYLGSGVGSYFWPGIPLENQSLVPFFEAHGYREDETSYDLIIDLRRYRHQYALSSEVEIVHPTTIGQAIEFEKYNFPQWTQYFADQDPRNIYIARIGDEIAGSVIILDTKKILWRKLLPDCGGVACLGVADKYRHQGIGLSLAAKVTEELGAIGLRHSYIGWTYLDTWYGKLGYKKWRCYSRGRIPAMKGEYHPA